MTNAAVRSMFRIHDGVADAVTGTWRWRVEPVAEHPVHSGHFPGRPVTPGAALVQLVQWLVSEAKGRSLHLRSARHIKFLTPVDPTKCNYFFVQISLSDTDDSAVQFDAEATTDAYDGNSVVLLKMKGVMA